MFAIANYPIPTICGAHFLLLASRQPVSWIIRGMLFTTGTYLHWGYEFDWPDAHHPVLNTGAWLRLSVMLAVLLAFFSE